VGVIDLAGGQIRATSSAPISLANAVTISGNTTVMSTGAGLDRDLTFTGPVTLVGGTRTLTVNSSPVAGGIGTSFNGAIGDGGNGYGLIKTGPGRLVLGGANTFTGGLTVLAGVLTATNAAALGGNGSGAVTLGDTTGSAAATLLGSGALTFANPLTIQAGSSGLLTLGNSGAGAVLFNGNVALNHALTLASDSTGSVTLGGAITGSAPLTVTGSSGNFVQLSGNNAAYTGDVTVASGTLRAGSAAALGAANGLTLSAGTALDLNNNSLTLRSLAGSGNVTQTGVAVRTLTVGDATDTTFSGALNATTPANLGLIKVGSGTLTLSGVSNYTGTTAINGGTLLLDLGTNHNGVLSSGSGLSLAGGALVVRGRTGSFVSAQSLGAVSLAANTASTIVLDPNGGTSTGLTLGNAWSRGAGSTLFIDLSAGSASVTSTPSAAVNGLLSFTIVKDQTGVGFGTVSGGQIVRFTGGTALAPNSNSATTNFTTTPTDAGYTSGKLTLLSGTHATNSLSITATPGTATLDLGAQTLSFASGGLLMTGSGDYIVQNGTLGASAAELIVQQLGTGKLTVSSAISGSTGSLTKSGSGTLALTGTNTYTGVTTIADGTLAVSGGNALANAGQVLLANKSGAVFRVESSETIGSLSGGGAVGGEVALASGTVTTGDVNNATYAGTITGSGALTKAGSGLWTLSGANSYSGLTTVSAGGLRITNGAALGDTGSVTATSVANGARLELFGGITVRNETATIVGNGGADSSGALRATGPGVNTWAGDVIIGAANARLGGSNESTLVVSGNVIEGAPNLGFQIRTDSVASKVVLSGSANAWGGPTNLVVGTLQLAGGANRLPVGTTFQMSNNQNIGSARFDLNGQDQQLAALVSNSTVSSSMEVTSATPATLTLTSNSGTPLNYVGLFTGALGLTKGGSAIYTLGGTNTYSGATNVNGGTLRATAAAAFSGSSAFTLANTAGVTLDLASFNQTIGSLAGGGAAGGNVTLGSGTLTTGGNNASTTYAGGVSGSGGLAKQGSGIFTVTGANSYTGPTVVTGGTLEVSGSISGSMSLAVTGSTLALSTTQAVNNASNTLTLGTGGRLDLADSLQQATETFGTLTLLGNAAIDFGSVGFNLGGNTLQFTNLTMGGNLLSITNWTGALGVGANPNSNPNQDRLLFGSGLSISDTDLAAIRFFDDGGSFLGTGAVVNFSGGYEIVPVPEPSAAVLLGLGGLLTLRRFRRRLAR
jgi:autotransporter-associated beta strand protein